MFPQRNLFLIANKIQAANGRRVPEVSSVVISSVIIERDYCRAWFRIVLSGHA